MKKIIYISCFIVATVILITWLVNVNSGLAWSIVLFAIGYFFYKKNKENDKLMQKNFAQASRLSNEEFNIFQKNLLHSFNAYDGTMLISFMSDITPEDKKDVLIEYILDSNKHYNINLEAGKAHTMEFISAMMKLYEEEQFSYNQKKEIFDFYWPGLKRIAEEYVLKKSKAS